MQKTITLKACRKLIYDYLDSIGHELEPHEKQHLRALIKGYADLKTKDLQTRLKRGLRTNRRLMKKLGFKRTEKWGDEILNEEIL